MGHGLTRHVCALLPCPLLVVSVVPWYKWYTVVLDEPLHTAVVDMVKLLRRLYQFYQVGPRAQCPATPAAFREHYAPRSASYYIFFLEEDANRLLEYIWPISMIMFSNNMVESLNKFLKETFNKHSARGSGKQKATEQSACGRPEAFVDSDADVLGQVLNGFFYIFTSTCTNTMFFTMFLVF